MKTAAQRADETEARILVLIAKAELKPRPRSPFVPVDPIDWNDETVFERLAAEAGLNARSLPSSMGARSPLPNP